MTFLKADDVYSLVFVSLRETGKSSVSICHSPDVSLSESCDNFSTRVEIITIFRRLVG